jgi:branched-chain amino acid transport system ATP-binding protein
MILLETHELTKRFGGLVAMNALDIAIEEGAIHGLIGPNGAGKSTFFNLVTGVLAPTSGRVVYDGKDITKSRPHQVAAMGVGRTFQLNPLFGDFTVFDNVATAHHLNPGNSIPSIYFNTKKHRENEAWVRENTTEILEFLNLSQVKDELAKNLPHGYQKILGVARALAIKPRLLMLDEPLGVMNPEEIAFSFGAISQLRDRGITVLVVEHNMQVLSILDHVTVISFGAKIFDGTPEEVRRDKTVIETYFGGDDYE